MARKDDLKQEYANVLRWKDEFVAAQNKVLAEEGEFVPINRLYAHCKIESNGDPKARSRGPAPARYRCPDPGISCSPDFYYLGLFQIYWPPFKVDWDKIYDPGYNAYCGAKTLALRKKQCGSWDGASMAFFAGSCVDLGAIDDNTGTDQATYHAAMQKHMKALQELGITDTDGTDPPSKDRTGNGSENTNTDSDCVTILGKEICKPNIDPTAIVLEQVKQYITSGFPRVALFAIGLVILIIGARSIV